MYKTELFDCLESVTEISPIFSQLSKISRIVESKNIPFAAIQWNQEKKGIDFLVNPEKFSALNPIEKQFVICHETMHIIFGHLEEWISGKYDLHRMNIATDILINESLFAHFGFLRTQLPNLENICTFNNVFTDDQIHGFNLSLSSHWKEIYTALKEIENINIYKTLETHSNNLENTQKNHDNEVKENKGEKEVLTNNPNESELPDKDGKVSLSISLDDCFNIQKAITGSSVEQNEENKITYSESELGSTNRNISFKMFQNGKQQKWEKLLSFVEPSRFSPDRGDKFSFALPNTVIGHIIKKQNLRLPARICTSIPKKNKIYLYFFWDISPSCIPYKEWFEDIVTHIPPNIFDVSIYAFDVVCHRLQLDYGSGLVAQNIESLQGTDFNALQAQIEQDLAVSHIPYYPDMVCVLTDGIAKPVSNIPEQYQNRWLWLITGIDENKRQNSFELGFVNLARNIITKKIIPIQDDYDVFNPQVNKGNSFCKMMPAYILD